MIWDVEPTLHIKLSIILVLIRKKHSFPEKNFSATWGSDGKFVESEHSNNVNDHSSFQELLLTDKKWELM